MRYAGYLSYPWPETSEEILVLLRPISGYFIEEWRGQFFLFRIAVFPLPRSFQSDAWG